MEIVRVVDFLGDELFMKLIWTIHHEDDPLNGIARTIDYRDCLLNGIDQTVRPQMGHKGQVVFIE